jgi:hypothetical protein
MVACRTTNIFLEGQNRFLLKEIWVRPMNSSATSRSRKTVICGEVYIPSKTVQNDFLPSSNDGMSVLPFSSEHAGRVRVRFTRRTSKFKPVARTEAIALKGQSSWKVYENNTIGKAFKVGFLLVCRPDTWNQWQKVFWNKTETLTNRNVMESVCSKLNAI